MINVRQGVFHLRNEEASYLFRVKDGFLEHLHFGARAEVQVLEKPVLHAEEIGRFFISQVEHALSDVDHSMR